MSYDDYIFAWNVLVIVFAVLSGIILYLMLCFDKELGEHMRRHDDESRRVDKALSDKVEAELEKYKTRVRSKHLYKNIDDDFDDEIIRLQQEMLERNKNK